MGKPEPKVLGEFGYTRRIVVAVLVVLFFVFAYLIRNVFLYLLFSILLAYLIALPVDYLQKWLKMPRMAAILVSLFFALIFLLGLGFLVVPPIADEFKLLVHDLPDFLAGLEGFINSQIERLGFTTERAFTIRSWLDQMFNTLQANLPEIAGKLFRGGISVVSSIGGAAFGFIFVPIMSYYLVKDSALFRRGLEQILPNRYRPVISLVLARLNVALGGYIRGQLLLCLLIGVFCTLGLLLLGVKYAFVLGLIAGIAEVIPMVGPIIGLVPALIIALVESPVLGLKVIILYLLIQGAENLFLAPRIRGDSMKMHPITVIIAMMIGAQIAGPVGMLIALPIVAVIKTGVEIYLESRAETNEEEALDAQKSS